MLCAPQSLLENPSSPDVTLPAIAATAAVATTTSVIVFSRYALDTILRSLVFSIYIYYLEENRNAPKP